MRTPEEWARVGFYGAEPPENVCEDGENCGCCKSILADLTKSHAAAQREAYRLGLEAAADRLNELRQIVKDSGHDGQLNLLSACHQLRRLPFPGQLRELDEL